MSQLLEFLLKHDPRLRKHLADKEAEGIKPDICVKESQWRHIFETLELEDDNERTADCGVTAPA